MIRKEITIVNKLGLHARAAAKFVTLAASFGSTIQVARAERTVNGKSIMGVMMLAAAKGARLELIIDGKDEAQAMHKLEQLVCNRFGESE